MIYFQVVDRTVREFLNNLMARLPVPASAGETPPGLTDSIIFYDPLVSPTRPGHILPAQLVLHLEAGETAQAELILIDMIRDAATAATVEYDGETEMLTIEEEEHRVRLKDVEKRKKLLSERCDRLGALVTVLKEWKVPEMPPPETLHPSAPAVRPADSPDSPGVDDPFFTALASRLRAIMDETGGELSPADIDESFRMIVDFGFAASVPPPALKRPGAPPEEFSAVPDHRVMHVSDYLIRRYSEFYQLPKIREIESALSTVSAAAADLKTRLARLQQKRLDVLRSSGIDLASDLDRLTQYQYRYFALESKRHKSPLSVDEKKQFGIMEEKIDDIEKKVDSEIYLRFPSSPEFWATCKRLNQATVQSLQELVRHDEDAQEKRDTLQKLGESYRNAGLAERWTKLAEQIERLKQFSKLLSGRGRRRPFVPVTPPPHPVAARTVLAALDRIQTLDMTLFPEKFLRRRGPPSVLLVPCFGSGLYDWHDGVLVISLYPENLDTAALAALAEFRLDADESKELLTAYGTQIGRYKNLGFVKLKEQFISDYTSWIQKEAAGYRVMEKDVRSWFERKIPLKVRES